MLLTHFMVKIRIKLQSLLFQYFLIVTILYPEFRALLALHLRQRLTVLQGSS
jgi:hypothetical protein